MSTPLDEVQEVLLAYYASKGRFPRPKDVTPKEVEDVKSVLSRAFTQMTVQHGNQRGNNGLRGTILTLDKEVDKYENEELLKIAREEIPLDELKAIAEALQESDQSLCYEDALAEALVKWFKPTYFKWIDPIPCSKCQGKTESKGMGQPTQDDLLGGAGRVELHRCTSCGHTVRFPRYNDPRYLMRSRVGRCGEFANLFALFIRAVGLRGRYVWNAEDHVWNEYYSPALKRWVHMDSCENARDQHLLYDVGWGKKQSYILAFSTEGAQDVSRAYIKDYDAALSRRNKISEVELESALAEVTRKRRAKLDGQRRAELEREDEWQARFLRGETEAEASSTSEEENLPPRQSGTAEWKAARGEDGKHEGSA
ncbi:peptide-N4-(N-acetyl-beta- glucosaminyl)asparagine amidase [Serendipita sp. 405]|nr:peptide-N4-(N-acetyl-beta- glucosaminyl)asparagine amidase [Serendipita sp. 397]KAG8773471.1 peptide-N4-(N-acetyl-beta- glucosaminyl)asparagine amidase [Serendipita sp. 398]KAG8838373.1 peptide-N4-(N-acetyl-beta- glucosaminyl)asparagine amidase [Serendipita sp. 405]